MEITTLCAVVATLRAVPNRSQFFQYESITMSCEHQGNCYDWRLRRNTTRNKNEDCSSKWDRNYSTFNIPDLYPSDSGVYWCKCGTGECSNPINITVTGGSVILEIPSLPVMEGQAVTLHCKQSSTSYSNVTTDFYKDGRIIGSSSTGNLTIQSVSRSDEGLYKCNITGSGESTESPLTVIARSPEPPNSCLTYVVLPVVGVCLLLVLVLLCLWRSHKGKTHCDNSYIDVTVTQEVQPHHIGDGTLGGGESFYSLLSLSNIT